MLNNPRIDMDDSYNTNTYIARAISETPIHIISAKSTDFPPRILW